MSARLISFAFLFLIANLSNAEVEIRESRHWRRARPLPVGQQLWSVQTSYRSTKQRYNNTGKLEPLGNRYSHTSTWKELIDSESSADVKAELSDYVANNRINPESIAAISSYEVETEETNVQIEWAYGFTSRWSIGVQVPLLWSRTNVQSKVSAAPSLTGAQASVNETVERAAKQQLTSQGFDAISPERQALEWGDINLINQFNILRTYNWVWSLQQNLNVPAAREQSAYKYIQMSRDEGQVDVGVTNVLDWRSARWTIGTRASYVVQLPDTVKMHSGNSVDQKVSRDLGDYYTLGGDVEYRLFKRWSTSLGFTYLFKAADRYVSTPESQANLETIAETSEQQIQQSRVGVDYLVDLEGIRQGVQEKWQVSLNYYRPINARNSVGGDRSALEITGFF